MTIEQLCAAHQATPIRPVALHMADGRSFGVPHRDSLSMAPTGRTVIVYGADDDFAVVDSLLLTAIEVAKSTTPQA